MHKMQKFVFAYFKIISENKSLSAQSTIRVRVASTSICTTSTILPVIAYESYVLGRRQYVIRSRTNSTTTRT
jgi:hypothetical protein